MRADDMPGEAILSNGTPADGLKASSQNALHDKTLQEISEKLEKSEAGRKKLRQAISMLKEKVEANEKVLQVNEILRQECEKERLRAEAERNRAEEEKKIREQIEEEGLSTKEQLVRVLQRLDAVERNCRSDRDEVERMRKEMKQAVSGLSGAVKAIDAAHSSFEGLEKSLLAKVSNAVSASTKSFSLAQTALTDAKGAQRTAESADKLSQSLVSRVAVLQEQGTSLDQRLNLLQQELRTRPPELSDNDLKANGNRSSDRISLGSEKLLSKGKVLFKNQPQIQTGSTTGSKKDYLAEGAGSKLECAELVSSVSKVSKPANRDVVARCGSITKARYGATVPGVMNIEVMRETPVKVRTLPSVSSALVGGRTTSEEVSVHCKVVQDKSLLNSSKGNIVREALNAAKQKRKSSTTTSPSKAGPVVMASSVQRSSPESVITDGAHSLKHQLEETEECKGRMTVDSGNGSMLALLGSEKNCLVENVVPVPATTASNEGRSRENCSMKGSCITQNSSRAAEETGAKTEVIISNPLLPGKVKRSEMLECRIQNSTNLHKKGKLPVVLLKDITKLFQKEKKCHTKVEQKLSALEKVLQFGNDNEGVKQGLLHTSGEKIRKRKRKSRKISSKKKACVQYLDKRCNLSSSKSLGVEAEGCQVRGEETRDQAGEVQASKRRRKTIVINKDSASPLQLTATKSCHLQVRGCGNDAAEKGRICAQQAEDLTCLPVPDAGVEVVHAIPHSLVLEGMKAATSEFMAPNQGICTDAEHFTGENGGWDSDSSESSEDGFGDNWWTTNRVLLSPGLPEVLPPSSLLEVAESNSLLSWPAANEMNLEDVALFLDVLPPIDQEASDQDRTPIHQEACDKGRTEAALTDIGNLKLETEDTHAHIVEPDGNLVKELQSKLAPDHACRENSINNSLVHDFEKGLNPPGKPDNCEEKENKENVIGGVSVFSTSTMSPSRPVSSVLLPQEANVVVSGKSVRFGNTSTFSFGASSVDVFRDSRDAVKQEKLDAVPSAAVDRCKELSHPYSLEFVSGHSQGDSIVNSFDSPMQELSMTERSRKVYMLFGRTRNSLHGALTHCTSDAVGSRQAVATELASMFVRSNLSELDLVCIFTAGLVDSHALWDNEKAATCLISEQKALQLLIDIVKLVLVTEVFQKVLLPDQAFSKFADQLQKFMIQGSIQPVSHPIPEEYLEEGSAVGKCFHFLPSTVKVNRLKALSSGSKLLAAFCETSGKLDFLCNSIYFVLRFCNMDSLWLLAAISSISCVCSKLFLSLDKEDFVGQAVHVVISELLNDAEAGRDMEASSVEVQEMPESQLEIQQGSGNGTKESSDVIQLLNLSSLRDVIGKKGSLSFEAFVPKLLESFHGVISTTSGSHLSDNRHLIQRSLWMRTCEQIEVKNENSVDAGISGRIEDGSRASPSISLSSGKTNGSTLQIQEDYDVRNPVEEYMWRFVEDKCSILCSTLQPVNQSGPETKLVEEWEQKFYDIVNAVDLLASHLGWEWTYNDLIVEHLWKLVAPGAPEMTVACVAHLFGLLGRLGRDSDSTELAGVDELRKSLLVVLRSDPSSSSLSGGSLHDFSFRAQVAAAQALLVLSSLNGKDEILPSKDPEHFFMKGSELQVESVKSLRNWVLALKPKIQEILPLSLRCALLSLEKRAENYFGRIQ